MRALKPHRVGRLVLVEKARARPDSAGSGFAGVVEVVCGGLVKRSSKFAIASMLTQWATTLAITIKLFAYKVSRGVNQRTGIGCLRVHDVQCP